MRLKRKGFTLVELIVVVTILAILGTIGFISYNGYLVGVRDSNRLTQLDQIASGLELYRAKNSLPLPTSNMRVEANGGLIGYQGYAGQDILDLIDYSKGGKDPKDNTYYTFYVSGERKYYQLLGFLEDPANQSTSFFTPQAYAADYTVRYFATSGKKLGVLVDSFNTPIQESSQLTGSGEFDFTNQGNTFQMIMSDKNVQQGTGGQLLGYNYQANCKRIKEIGGNKGDGVYQLNPRGNNKFDGYCNMTIDGGGWLLIGRSNALVSSSSFGFSSVNGTVSDDSKPYSLGILSGSTLGIPFTEIMFGDYVAGKDFGERIYKIGIPNSLTGLGTSGTGIVANSTKGLGVKCTGPSGGNGTIPGEFGFVGHTSKQNGFFISNSSSSGAYGLLSTGFTINTNASSCANGELNASGTTIRQGIIFVR